MRKTTFCPEPVVTRSLPQKGWSPKKGMICMDWQEFYAAAAAFDGAANFADRLVLGPDTKTRCPVVGCIAVMRICLCYGASEL